MLNNNLFHRQQANPGQKRPLPVDSPQRSPASKYIVRPQDFPGAQAAIVLGAYVFTDGELCEMLADRIETAVELYKDNKVKKIIMTGDHGRKDYDEVNNMRIYAEKMGVPTEDIFMDHAGIYAGAGYYSLRETPARIKAFLEVNSHAKPVFLCEVIPVSGDGRATHDGN